MVLYIVLYVVLATAVVFCSIKLADYVDLIDKKTNLSGAFIGGVILAAVTSLPELFTSISAVTIVNEANLVLGNVLGSNIFNMTVLGALMVIFTKKFSSSRVGKSHFVTTIFSVLLFVLVIIALFAKGFNDTIPGINVSIYSIIILALYVVSIRFMAGDSAEGDGEDTSPLTIKQIAVRFTILALILVGCSIAVTYVTDVLATELNLGATLAGALFLGIATSLPELTSCFALAKKGNFNACVGNIMGSGIFNFFILMIADVLYFSGSVYKGETQTQILAVFGLISAVLVTVTLLLKNRTQELSYEKVVKLNPVYFVIGVMLIAAYIGFIVLSA